MGIRRAVVLAGLLVGFASSAAHAAYIININQVGANVIANGSGSIDFRDLTFDTFQSPYEPGVSNSYIEIGNTDPAQGDPPYGDYYIGITGPSSFGTSGFATADSSVGNIIGVDAAAQELILPGGYFSNEDLGPSSATFNGTTLARLGLTSGTYTYTWGSQNQDSLTINIASVSLVPLPASAPMFGAALLGLAGIGYAAKRKKVAAAV